MPKTTTWIEGGKLGFPVLLDPEGRYYESLGLPSRPYPIAYLLDATGRVVWVGAPVNRGAFADACEAQLERLLRSARKEAAGPSKSGR